MRGKRRLRAAQKEHGRRGMSEETDPSMCECGHHAGLAVMWHHPFCPVTVKHRQERPR